MEFIGEAVLISVLWIFHTSLSLYLYITMYTKALCNVLKHLFGGKTTLQRLEDLCQHLTKIPEHISFLMLESSVTEKSLAELVAWSLVLGIQNISLYDHKGRLKENQDSLLLHIHHYVKKLKLDKQIHVTWQPNSSLSPCSQDKTLIIAQDGSIYVDINANGEILTSDGIIVDGTTNGNCKNGRNGKNGNCVNEQSKSEGNGHCHMNGTANGVSCKQLNIRLTLLSADDGKQQIVRCTQGFSERVARRSLKAEQIDEALVNKTLSESSRLPDPELLVRVGKLNSNHEYPPWEIRLSEMHSIDPTAGVHLQQFADVMMRYSKCEQRFGK